MKAIVRLFAGLAVATALIPAARAGEGKVVSSINTDMYTYVEVEQDGKNVWIAGPAVAVKPGNLVRYADGPLMSNFYSKQLQRSFPSVMFVERVVVTAEK